MCGFSIDRMNFDVWVKQRTIIELLSKEHTNKLIEAEKQRLIAEEQKRKDEEEAEKKR